MFCTNCGKELKPGAKFCTTCGCPVDADDAGETKVVSSPDETSVVSPDTTTVSGPAAETTVIPESPTAPEHDREADTAAAVASFDDVEPASAPAYAAPAPVPPAPAGEAPKKKGHGALIIGICESLIKGAGATTFSDAFTFALLIVVLAVKPTGLFSENLTEKV